MKDWREKNKERFAAWFERNKEHRAAYRREYQQKNRERLLTKKREYRERTKERRALAYKEWSGANKARKSAQNLAWRRANRERVAEYTRVYSREKPWISLLATARRRAAETGVEYSLSIDWFKSKWTGLCELSGIELIGGNGAQHMRSPSIDRIDPKRGYVPDNCRIICLALNAMRGAGTDAEMMEIIVATLEFQLSRNEAPPTL